MPIPLIPIIAAWAAGGTLVSHAAGGAIVTGAGGYVAGTYLSCAAISGLYAAASAAAVGACAVAAGVVGNTIAATSATAAAVASGASASVASAAGAAGVTGASVAKGALVSAGLLPAVPMWIPIAVAGVTLGCGYCGYRILKQRGYFDGGVRMH